MSSLNRDRALTSEDDYDYVTNPHLQQGSRRPRQGTQQTLGGGEYEVSTPLNIRLMRMKHQEQESRLGPGLEEEDKDGRLYSQEPKNT